LTNIDPYGASVSVALLLANAQAKLPDGSASSSSLLALKDLKAKEIEMELVSVYGSEALQISLVQKLPTHFLQGTTKLGDDSQ
jgi:hypothetical protein